MSSPRKPSPEEGDIARRSRERWQSEMPDRDHVDMLTWTALKRVVMPMLREMANELEALRGEVAELRSRRKGRDE